MNKFLFFGLLIFANTAFSQSTIRVMQYNLLYYGGTHYDCNSTSNNLDTKNAALNTILNSLIPEVDVLCVNELDENESYADYLLNNVLKSDNKWWWKRANGIGYSIINMIYYDSRKLELVEHKTRYVYPRVVDFFKMYVKAEDLEQTHDTVFITFISAHLLSGNDENGISTREESTNTIMGSFSAGLFPKGNYVLLGDFNFYSAYEAGYQNLVNYSDVNYRFYDPVNASGEWSNNYSYANYHTQSTHTSSNGCAITGGLDDRFDFILISNPIKFGTDEVSYKAGSYTTIGQDGSHFNDAVNYGYNSAVSSEVATALYNMSDHLPVTLELNITQTIKVDNSITQSNLFNYNSVVDDFLRIEINNNIKSFFTVKIFSITGKLLKTETFRTSANIDLSNFGAGMYIVNVFSEKEKETKKIVVL